MDTDADTDTDTVIWVETVEWCLRMKELTLSRTGHETNSRGRAMVADGAVRERARPREVVRVS